MKTSQTGIGMIKSSEGVRLKSYQDGGGVWTIGYGHTNGVKRGMVIAESGAANMLQDDLHVAEEAVNRYVKIPITQNEFDALVSFTFNLGTGALQKSTLLSLLNKGDRTGAADQFLRWNHDNGHEVVGLTNRRKNERALFLSNKTI